VIPLALTLLACCICQAVVNVLLWRRMLTLAEQLENETDWRYTAGHRIARLERQTNSHESRLDSNFAWLTRRTESFTVPGEKPVKVWEYSADKTQLWKQIGEHAGRLTDAEQDIRDLLLDIHDLAVRTQPKQPVKNGGAE
jgi:hypothetical protein